MRGAPAFDPLGQYAAQIAILLSIALFVLAMATLAAILLLHRHHQRNARNQARLFEVWLPLLARYLGGDEPAPALIKGAQRHPYWFLEMMTRQAMAFKGPVYERLQSLLEITGVTDWLRTRLRSNRPGHIADAARAMAIFRDAKSRPRLRQLLDSPKPSIAFSAALALARIAEPQDLNALFTMLNRYSLDNPDLVLLVLVGCGENDPEQFATFIRQETISSPNLKTLVLEVIGHLQLAGVDDLLRSELLSPSSHEAELKALRAIGETQAAGLVDLARQALTSSRWEARAIAAWSAGRLRDLVSLRQLVALLGDEQWSVRINAAGGLVGLGADGLNALEHAAEFAPDPFARDAATHALGRTRATVPLL